MFVKDGKLFNKVKHINLKSQQDKDDLRTWCHKCWSDSLRGELLLKKEKMHFMCCNVFVDKNECTVSGHPIESCRPIDMLCSEFQVICGETLYQAMLKWAEEAISIGKQLKFPSMNTSHRGLSICQQVILDQAEVGWHRQHSAELEARNLDLEKDNESLRQWLKLVSKKTGDWCRFGCSLTQSWQELFEKATAAEQEISTLRACSKRKVIFETSD